MRSDEAPCILGTNDQNVTTRNLIQLKPSEGNDQRILASCLEAQDTASGPRLSLCDACFTGASDCLSHGMGLMWMSTASQQSVR